jgi:phage replication O-like protein O
VANPQVENGHVKIANEIIEQLAKINLSNYEWRILMVILRKTYGWNKKIDTISLSQFQEATGITTQHVAVTIKRLVNSNIIIKHNGNKIMEYGLQKDYSKWLIKQQPLPKKVVPIQVVPNDVVPNKVVPIQVVHEIPSGSTDSGSTPVPIQVVPATLTASADSGSNKRQYKDNITKDSEFLKISNLFNEEYKTELSQSSKIREDLNDILETYGYDIFYKATKKVAGTSKCKLAYVYKIMEDYKINGIPNENIKPQNKKLIGADGWEVTL